ncbi:ABC transporter substrate-binding protein [Demequina sp. TTPB684]|uniref:ABC transporter substrate-binding protein n=1 Tax=unclassified Demequina TaxID=2620311 RepID=UPI001CF5F839|nr:MULTISPECIES: ABC transporter substrate-binding protein [unclassified Demequina]MCB2411362.1 ABC transporter substrate-binding protein [Demequina sp. TTPB684]UPU87623.1 ABC transporter substrate-binding protein [Demequina sp. TMPB413]
MKVQLATVAVSGLLLAGCSSSDDPDTTGTMTTDDGGNMAAGCEAYADYGTFEGDAVELYGTISGVEAEQLEQSITKFEECTGIDVTYNGSDEFETEINIRVEGGNAPDLAIIPQPGLLQRVVGTGAVVAAPESVEANVDEFWSEDWKNYGTVGETFYAAPLMASVKGWVWYSPTEFAEKGYEVPTTWDGLMELTAEMAANPGSGANYAPWCIGFESGTATGWPGTDWIEDIVLRQQGPEAYDAWVAGDLDFTSPEITEAFEAFGAIALDPEYVNGGLGDSASIVDTAFQEAGLQILEGSCSLHHQASFYEAQWPEGTNVDPEGDVWAFLTPKIDEADGDAVTGGGEFVAAFNDNPATVALQTFLASDTWANERVSIGGVISANKGLDPNNASSPIGQESIEILQGEDTVFRFDASDLMPAQVGSSAFWTGMNDYVTGKPLETVLTDIENAWP